jgi:hypothetical protein
LSWLILSTLSRLSTSRAFSFAKAPGRSGDWHGPRRNAECREVCRRLLDQLQALRAVEVQLSSLVGVPDGPELAAPCVIGGEPAVQHQHVAQHHQAADRSVAERHRERGADEGCEGEHRAGASRAEGPGQHAASGREPCTSGVLTPNSACRASSPPRRAERA